jgi:hypothetical protein
MFRSLVVLLCATGALVQMQVEARAEESSFAKAGTLTLSSGFSFSTDSGDFRIKGDATQFDLPDSSDMSLFVGIGAFVVDGLMLKIEIGVGYDTQDDIEAQTESVQFSYGIAFEPSYYIALDQERRLHALIYARLGYSGANTEADNFKLATFDETTRGGISYGAGVGLALSLGTDLGAFVQLTLGYLGRSYTTELNWSDLPRTEAETERGGLQSLLTVGAYF